MTYAELVTILRSTGYPVAYSHFAGGMPTRPCIAYVDSFSSNFNADNHVYVDVPNVQIELYTDIKDISAENAVKTALNNAELPYDSTGPVWLDSEGVFQTIYEVRMI